MKLLVISHACVTPINQQFYAEVERQTGWDLTIVTPSNWKNEYGNKLNSKRWSGYQGQLLNIPVWKSGDIPLHIYRSIFIPIFQKLQPDAIYVNHEPYGAATAQLYLANYLSIRKPIGFFTWQNIFKHYPFPFQQLQNFVFKESSFAFPGSRSAEEVIRRKGYEGISVILPSGIEPEVYFPYPEAEVLKSKLRGTENEALVGYVGRIVEEKGLKTLLYALQKIQELPWQLVVIGSGSYEAEFDAIAQDLQLTHRINRLGYIPHTEAPLYLSAFDLLVLPSETRSNWKEQFGRVIIEAIACGTPVIGSDSGEIPHLIEATGGGLTFLERQSTMLAEQLKQLILNPSLRSKLVERGRQVVLNNYTNTSLVQRFAQTIEKAIHES
jgi:glycosyltransferase involved in cell wall biosynthesis